MLQKRIPRIVLSAMIMFIFAGCDKKNNNVNQQQVNMQQNEEIDGNEQDPTMSIANETNSDDISMVQSQIMCERPELLRVDQALNKWEGHSNPNWKTKIGENGEKLVIFTNNYDSIECDKQNSKIPDLCDKVKNVEFLMVFKVDGDGNTAQVNKMLKRINFQDGKSYIDEITNSDGTQTMLSICKVMRSPAVFLHDHHYDERQ